MRGIVLTYDLIPDGVKIVVAWENMGVGTSIFVPCINTTRAVKEVKQITAEKGWGIETRVCEENGMQGVRIWRNV